MKLALRRSSFEALIPQKNTLLYLLLFTLIFRLLTLQYIDDSGDSKFYWIAARQLFQHGLDYEFNHWSTRFGVVFPLFLTRALFGKSAGVYFVLPIFMSMVQTFFLYHLVRLVSDKRSAVVCSVLMLVYPQMVRSGSQILPGIFSSSYITASYYFYLRALKSDKKRYAWIIVSALAMFAAYESKITNLFFLPGYFLFILFYSKKKLHDLFLFFGVLASFFLIETAFYRHYTDYSLGRLSVISGSHLSDNDSLKAVSFFGLFWRFLRPGPHFTLIFLYYIYASISLIATSKSDYKKGAVFLTASAYFFLTFSVKSINPLVPAINTQIRYLVAMQAMMFAVIIFDLGEKLSNFKGSLLKLDKALILLFILVVASYLFAFRQNLVRHPIIETVKTDSLIDTFYRESKALVYPLDDSTWFSLRREMIKYESGEGGLSFTTSEKQAISHNINRITKHLQHINYFYNDDFERNDQKSQFVLRMTEFKNREELLYAVRYSGDKTPGFEELFSNPSAQVLRVTRRPFTAELRTVAEILAK